MRQPKDFQRNSPPSQAACEASFSTSNSKAWSTGPSYVWLPFPLAMFDYRRVWNNQYWYPPKLPRCIEQRRAKDPHIAIQFGAWQASCDRHRDEMRVQTQEIGAHHRVSANIWKNNMFGILGSDFWCKQPSLYRLFKIKFPLNKLNDMDDVRCERLESFLASKLEISGGFQDVHLFSRFSGQVSGFFKSGFKKSSQGILPNCPNLDPKLFPDQGDQGAVIHSTEAHHTDLLILRGPASPLPSGGGSEWRCQWTHTKLVVVGIYADPCMNFEAQHGSCTWSSMESPRRRECLEPGAVPRCPRSKTEETRRMMMMIRMVETQLELLLLLL